MAKIEKGRRSERECVQCTSVQTEFTQTIPDRNECVYRKWDQWCKSKMSFCPPLCGLIQVSTTTDALNDKYSMHVSDLAGNTFLSGAFVPLTPLAGFMEFLLLVFVVDIAIAIANTITIATYCNSYVHPVKAKHKR